MINMLLVDDERIIREGIEAMLPLEKLNIRLTASCANAFDALDSMADDMPDVLLTDIKMPRMDGLALIERALQINPLLRCIVLSGYDEFALAQRALKMGVKEYLLKPCTREDLLKSLETICKDIRHCRKRASDRMDHHLERVKELAEQLDSLSPNDPSEKISGRQVRALVQATEDEKLLREAYTYLIARNEAQAERGFAAIQSAYRDGSDSAELIAMSLNQREAFSSRYRGFVQRMCTYIQEHYADESLSLQYLADHEIHMRADYLGREFTKDTGMKLSAYLLQIRMEKAKTLLKNCPEESRVYEIAEQVGLGHNPQYFSQLFRKYTGMTPTEYSKIK